MIQDHDPGDEDRDEVPTLTVERARELIDQATAGARELHQQMGRIQPVRFGWPSWNERHGGPR